MEICEEEIKLSEQLRSCCDSSGKETDLARSTEIIHKLGLVYRRRSPDKTSLLQSVGLLNAAIARKPANVLQIKSDLSEICQHILHLSEATNPESDLVNKAKEVKLTINQMRDRVNDILKNPVASKISKKKPYILEKMKISIMQTTNQFIADQYTNIMAGVCRYCEEVMGKSPCEYSLAGMGSLARKEITPYSDFEHILLLEDDENYQSALEYFRWLSVIFHVIVLNLQETIIPSLNISCLNNAEMKGGDWYFDAYTPRGICFDGMMPHACKFPLGRWHTKNKPWATELIRPVIEMLKYLSSEENIKNGYHLSDILTKTCFIYGSKKIFEQFSKGVQQINNNKSQDEVIEVITREVKQDLNQFSTKFRLSALKLNPSINIKQTVYRSSTLFISALGKIFNCGANSCADIIEELAIKEKISNNTKHKLLYAVSIACEMRLRVYMASRSQRDHALSYQEQRNKPIKAFADIVGLASTINYFQIAYCLQCEVAKHLKFATFHFYSSPQLINVIICLLFEETQLDLSTDSNDFIVSWEIDSFDFDTCIGQLEKGIAFASKGLPAKSANSTYAHYIDSVAKKLCETNLQDDAVELFKHLLKIYDKEPGTTTSLQNAAKASENIGDCLSQLQQFDEALKYYNKSLQINQNLSLDENRDWNVAKTLNNIGICYTTLGLHQHALNYYRDSLKIYQNVLLDYGEDTKIASLLYNMGNCLYELHQHDDALEYYNKSLLIRQNTSFDKDEDRRIASLFYAIANCLHDLQRYEEALSFHHKSLSIYQNAAIDEDMDCDVAWTLNNIGRCLFDLCRYAEALSYHSEALRIYEHVSLNEEKDRDIACTSNDIAKCFVALHHSDEALSHCNRSLRIYQNVTLDETKDRNIACTLGNIGNCHFNLHQYHDALKNHNRSLLIWLNRSLDEKDNSDVAWTLNNIGDCWSKLHRYDDALNHYQRSLLIYQNIVLDKEKDRDVAWILKNIGESLYHLNKYNDALKYHKMSLQIYQTISVDEEENLDVAKSLENISECLSSLQQYTDAVGCYKQCLEIYRNASYDEEKDLGIACIQNRIGNCLSNLKQYNEALIHHKKSLLVILNSSINEENDRDVAYTLNCIGYCLSCLDKCDEALAHHKKAFQIYLKISLDKEKDRDLAWTLRYVGNCLYDLHEVQDALNSYNRSFQIFQNLSQDEKKDYDVAVTINNTASCLSDLQRNDDALK